eukprot:g822.t1
MDEVPEMRVSTLTPSSVELIRRCGAWDDLAPPNSAAVEQMQVWDYGSSGFLRWSAQQVGHSNMGLVVENSLIQSSLLRSLANKTNVEAMYPVGVQSLKLPNCLNKGEFLETDLATLRLTNGRHLRSRLVIGADGASSRVRQLVGLQSNSRDYEQKGLVATVSVSNGDATAWQRFLPTGPFALLPVRNNYFNVVWSTTPQMAEAVQFADPSSAVHAFNEALSGGPVMEPVLSRLTTDSSDWKPPPKIINVVGDKPKSFPLRCQLASNFVSSRLALVGDAYRVVHPLAGQGVNLGFGDIHQLTLALNKAIKSGQDIGDLMMLRTEYESQRRFESQVMMTALDAIREAFRVQSTPLQRLRGFGLEALNQIKPFKDEIMLYAMGMKPALTHLPFR